MEEHNHTRHTDTNPSQTPEEILAVDAKYLVLKAREALKATGIDNASNDEVVAAIKILVGAHREDFNKVLQDTKQTLEGAVTAELYTEEEQERLAQARSREGARSQYEGFIDGLQLSKPDALKLKEMMSDSNYVNAVETAKEMKASKIPTYEQIVAELVTFPPERLKDICAEMERPKLQIVSDQNFDGNIGAMDENKHYTSADGQSQEDAYVYRGSDSPYNKLAKPGKVKVSIVDGVARPKQLTGVSTRLGERRDHLTEKFATKNMSHIDQNEMATLIQQSLREARSANDNNLIVDNWEDGTGTVTFINPGGLTKSALVACSVFILSFYRQAYFVARNPYRESDLARGRASVQVLEI
ncbi:MAG: hypothetical protein WC285_02405 [Candidatus Gracilibacteria bacterium]|jgi:hypothetical protein